MKKTNGELALIFLTFRTKDWLMAYKKVERHLLNQNYEVKLVDVSMLIWPRHISVYGKPLRKLQVAKKRERGGQYKRRDNDADLSAIRSFRRDSNRSVRSFEKILFQFAEDRLDAYLNQLKSSMSPDLVVIPNGRLPHEIHIEQCFSETRLAYYELPYWGKDAFYAGFSPQEHTKLRSFISSRILFDRDTLYAHFSEAIERRKTSKYGLNPFAVDSEHLDDFVRPGVVFFTSSNDEYWQLGRKSKTNKPSEWGSQVLGFDLAIAALMRAGHTQFTIRMHPNLANKSIKEYRREMDAVRKLQNKFGSALLVIRPEQEISSYVLAQNASLVVIWWSVTGLESSAVGKPVLALHEGRYVFDSAMHLARTKTELKRIIDYDLQSPEGNRKKAENAKLIIGALAEQESFITSEPAPISFADMPTVVSAYVSGGPARVVMGLKFRLLRISRRWRYKIRKRLRG